MKIFYLTNGLPHYFNFVLTRLNSVPGLELVVVVPKHRSKFIGDGVFQSRTGIDFRVEEMPEYSFGPIAGFKGLTRLLVRERPDIVIVPEHLLVLFFLHPGLVLARKIFGMGLILKSIPFLLSRYEIESQKKPARMPKSLVGKTLALLGIRQLAKRGFLELRRMSYRFVDAHINYVDSARDIYGSYGVSESRIFVTRNSPDTDEMEKTLRRVLAQSRTPIRDRGTILHVGRLVPEKRVDLLLIAFQIVHKQFAEAKLVIVGDGPQRGAYEALAVELDISQSVRFVGAVYEPSDLAIHFLGSSIFALPGLGGLSINEAMLHELAIVCSVGDGTEKFLVRQGYNGAFFQENDASSLAEALVDLLKDPEDLRLMGQRSRSIIEEEVNIHTVISEYVRAFQYVVSAHER